jgi:hypothetical protein
MDSVLCALHRHDGLNQLNLLALVIEVAPLNDNIGQLSYLVVPLFLAFSELQG